ncbi:hypothetical protein [Hymenobacter sp. GOD-10R]|uniref:hypothetical protein n=1 Tax=Hymenobacter sp. GOD-10R TaxID=3093922 RepID=UPI002D79E7AC|nr:hypothetical protein [Hymenobacter sp. GOD-10R]WRQ26221.1 hypothetical protein SD425_14150 [Hymenobacter sp. GOD-10R]
MRKQLVIAAFGLLAMRMPATAQNMDLGGALDLPQLVQTLTMSAAIRADAERRATEKGIKLSDSDAATTKSTARLTYTPTASLRQQTVQNLAQRLQTSNPAQAKALNAAFGPGKTDYGQLYAAGLKGSGFQDNDAASALAAYLEIAYVVANNVQDTKAITPAMDRGLRTQAAGLLRKNTSLTDASTVAKLGEELKLQTLILLSGWQQSLKTGQTASFSSNIAQQFANQYHFDLTQVKLTEQGFTKK